MPRWRASRVAVAAAALALLAGTPAALIAAGVTSRPVLAAATALAAAVGGTAAVWQGRYQGQAQRGDELAVRVAGGCLVLPGGALPRVGDITDPVRLGVHRAAPAPDDGPGDGGQDTALAPAYVPRDTDAALRGALACGGFVLLVGDSTAGKSRAAFEAITEVLPGHVLIVPAGRDAAGDAVTRAAQAKKCVLWLDDLERYLGTGGLTAAHVGRLLTGTGHHRIIVATLRAAERARLTDDAGAGDSQVLRETALVLDQAREIRVPRMFSGAELGRARELAGDPRIAEALAHTQEYGIAEYLAAGPVLLRDWQDARHSVTGPHARGAALVAAAVDIRRAGYTSPLPRALLDQAHESYLGGPGQARAPREPLADAWDWATRRRVTTALLLPVAGDRVEVFDYLVDAVQRTAAAGDHVPEDVVRAAVRAGEPSDAGSLAETAYRQGRYALAEHAWRHAWQDRAASPDLGAEHPDTLTSRSNLATVLSDLGRLDEAEAENRAVLDTRVRVLGAEHPDTLTSRSNLATVLRDLGRLAEAEAENRAVLDTLVRVLGAEHPSTLTSRSNLALVLAGLGRLAEAEAENGAVLDTRVRVLGPEHPDTLTSRSNLATVLYGLGRLAEAEAENRAVLDTLVRVLGAEHPSTLTSRSNLAIVLRGLGRLAEAEAENRAVLDARVRVLGAEHPSTLTSRSNLAIVLRGLGRLAEAEAENRAVLDARVRVLGAEHPSTLTSRSNLATVLRDLGRLDEAEAENRAVLDARARTGR